MTEIKDNALTEVKWLKTNQGMLTPLELFLNRDHALNLEESVAGYLYGAEYRFLMTIYALLAAKDRATARRGGIFEESTVREVFELLSPYGDIFASKDPFLQVTPEDITVEVEGTLMEPSHLPGKLLPQGQTPLDNQSIFWNLDSGSASFSLEEATLALVANYFYGVGTNTKLTTEGKKTNKLQNGTSGLRYKESIEIIPQAEGVLESLSLSVPSAFLTYHGSALLPHWADRRGNKTSIYDPLWRFSWSSNTVYCNFDDEGNLLKVTRGGIPVAWSSITPFGEGETWPKGYHDARQVLDPLYFYRAVDGDPKLWRSSLSSDPYYAVAQWHFEELSRVLDSKIADSVRGSSNSLMDMLFLEHGTEGAANSFNIRHSKVIRGWKEELMPNNGIDGLQGIAADVLAMRRKLRGLFSETGTCKHLAPRVRDVEDAYWRSTQMILEEMVQGELTSEKAKPRIKKAAVEAFERVSSRRDLTNIKAHMNGLQLIGSFKF